MDNKFDLKKFLAENRINEEEQLQRHEKMLVDLVEEQAGQSGLGERVEVVEIAAFLVRRYYKDDHQQFIEDMAEEMGLEFNR